MDIEVKTKKLREKSGDQKKIRNELNTINNSIQISRKKLQSCLTSSASGQIDKSLGTACKSLQNITNWIGDMADGLDTIAGLYETAEQDISGNQPNEDAINEVKNEEEWTGIKWWDVLGDFFKQASKIGFVGTMGVSAWKIWQDDNWVKKLVDGLKLGNGVVANFFKHKLGTSWKEILFGKWNVGKDVAKAVKDFAKHPIQQIKSALGDKVGEYSVKKSLIKDGKKLVDTEAKAAKGKVFAKWAGGIITVVDKMVGNVKEFGGENGAEGDVTKGSAWGKAVQEERFWKETVTEAALEIGKDILIGAAIAAVVGSGGWIAVLGTAAISVALDAGANAIARNDKGFTENLSDGIINLGEKIDAKKTEIKNKVFTKWFSGNASFVTA